MRMNEDEKEIRDAFALRGKVIFQRGNIILSSDASRLLAALWAEGHGSGNEHGFNHMSHKRMRAYCCSYKRGSKRKKPLLEVITECVNAGLIHDKRSPYTERKGFGYKLTERFHALLPKMDFHPWKPRQQQYHPHRDQFILAGERFNTSFLNEISLHRDVVDLIDENKGADPWRLMHIAYDVHRLLYRRHFISVGKTGRVTMLTNTICKEIRPYLTYKGERLVEGDIASAHPTLLQQLYNDLIRRGCEGAEREKYDYKSFVESEMDFYDFCLSPSVSAPQRDEIKVEFNSYLNGNRIPWNRANIAMHDRFPLLADRIDRLNEMGREKRKDRIERLAKDLKISKEKAEQRYDNEHYKLVVGSILQVMESMIICKLAFRISRKQDKIFLPIHDGFQCRKSDLNYFKSVIHRGFEKRWCIDVRINPEETIKDDYDDAA